MNRSILIGIFLIISSVVFAQKNTVRLRGELANFSNPALLEYQELSSYLTGKSKAIEFDEQNKFDVTIELEEPQYFRLGRNLLYLEPGFDLYMYLDYKGGEAAYFSGKGWTENTYLKNRAFPKGGSYLMAGKLLKTQPSFKEVKELLFNKYQEYSYRLKSFPGMSERFIKNEEIRNNLSLANSFYSYPGYALTKRLSHEEYKAYTEKWGKKVDPIVKKYLKKCDVTAEHLQLEVFRKFAYKYNNYFKDSQIPQFIKDFNNCSSLLGRLKSYGLNQEVFKYKKEIEAKLTDKKYIKILDEAFAKYESLEPGKLAPVLTITDTEGNKHLTSDFKGKYLVIDVWATWCGPCCAMAPLYHELAANYKDNSDIVFISLSVDSNKKAWLNHISKEGDLSHHYNISNSKMKPYLLNGIPRFIIIDKEGKIYDAFAPKPAEGKLQKLIENIL